MNTNVVIRVDDLGKKYRIRHQNSERYTALRDVIANSFRASWVSLASTFRSRVRSIPMDGRPTLTGAPPDAPSSDFKRTQLRKHSYGIAPFLAQEDFWALRGVSFDVERGSVVGIVGRNGAGKSTLLKLLSRITEPTTGEIEIEGRVASLLEVGTGFHPELTGRENVFLNGAILGMTRLEIKKRFDEIVAFAEVEKFLDTPVKRYSSGMYMRLAFAVAAHLEAEILVVDEVLSVGDAEFQSKCVRKMNDVASGGRTILFVSHNMQAVSLLCDRALVIDRGSLTFAGAVKEAIALYMTSYADAHSVVESPEQRSGTGEYRFTRARAAQTHFTGAEPKTILFEIQRRRHSVGLMWLSAHVVDREGAVLVQCDSRLVGFWLQDCHQYRGRLNFTTPWLKPGFYRVDLFICTSSFVTDSWEGACSITISPLLPYSYSVSEDGTSSGLVFADFSWSEDGHA